MSSEEEAEGTEVEEKRGRKGRRRKSEVQKKEMVEKVQREDRKLPDGEEEEKKGRKSHKRPRTTQVLQKSERWLLLFALLGQNCLRVNAAAEALQRRTEIMEMWQQQ